LNGVADYFGVDPQTIVDWPGNRLDSNTLGDWSFPNIAEGTELFIPNGERDFINWSVARITREDPTSAYIYGEGACGQIYEGAVGTGTYIWPSVETYLSGYDFTPDTNHWGIDVAGDMGYAIFAVDSGVVVYAGWNNLGYGNVIVIDHGDGWQSLYAHLSSINVYCGQSVAQGDVIAGMGSTGKSTGPHLHFELMNENLGRVNPWLYLIY
jgi:hypothetical protein